MPSGLSKSEHRRAVHPHHEDHCLRVPATDFRDTLALVRRLPAHEIGIELGLEMPACSPQQLPCTKKRTPISGLSFSALPANVLRGVPRPASCSRAASMEYNKSVFFRCVALEYPGFLPRDDRFPLVSSAHFRSIGVLGGFTDPHCHQIGTADATGCEALRPRQAVGTECWHD